MRPSKDESDEWIKIMWRDIYTYTHTHKRYTHTYTHTMEYRLAIKKKMKYCHLQ